MKAWLESCGLFAVGAWLLATPAVAGDWYVDAVHGNDANGGTSPSDAWRTITHALAVAPAPPSGQAQVLHVAPGTYDAALGESFPLLPRDAFQIVGDVGPDATTIDAGGAGQVVKAWHDHFGGNYVGPLTAIRGVTLVGGAVGVDVQCGTGAQTLTLQDVRILGMTSSGVRSNAICGWGCGTVSLTLEGVEISACALGVELVGNVNSASYASHMTLRDCQVVGNATLGVHMRDVQGGLELVCERTRIGGNGAEGLLVVDDAAVFGGPTAASLSDCLIDGNLGGGVRGTTTMGPTWVISPLVIDLERCTLTGNAVAGLDVFRPAGSFITMQVTLDSSLFWANADDIRDDPTQPAITSVQYCDIGDGDFAGSKGNFAADPLFVDPSNLDYRLRWASPCIETGDPAGVAGTPDLAGNARPIDGDLDTQERFDVGAFEFAPLFMKSTGELGTPLVFELWGPQGNATTVYFARKPLVAPQMTPFGELDLEPAFMNVFRLTTVGAGPPKTIKRTIPTNPSYAGLVFSFQALTDCAVAPLGKAYTNAVELTLVP